MKRSTDTGRSKMFHSPIQPSRFGNSSTFPSPPGAINSGGPFPMAHCNGVANVPWTEQIPPTMPWAVVQEPSLMRFTAQTNPDGNFATQFKPVAATNAFPTPVLISPDPCSSQTATQWELLHKLASPTMNGHNPRLKRRNSSSEDDDDYDLQPPSKVTLTEEKVAERLKCMSLDRESDTELIDEDEVDYPKVHLSEEVKQVMNQVGPIDKLIREEISKPSKALVLWTPPCIPLPSVYSNVEDDEEDNDSRVKIEEIFDSDPDMMDEDL